MEPVDFGLPHRTACLARVKARVDRGPAVPAGVVVLHHGVPTVLGGPYEQHTRASIQRTKRDEDCPSCSPTGLMAFLVRPRAERGRNLETFLVPTLLPRHTHRTNPVDADEHYGLLLCRVRDYLPGCFWVARSGCDRIPGYGPAFHIFLVVVI